VTEETKKAEDEKSTNVVDVLKPEDWTPAEEVSDLRWIPTASGDKQFKLRALSYLEENETYSKIKDPEVPAIKRNRQVIKNPEDPEYQKALSRANFLRNVMKVDLCWAKIPGETIEEKGDWFDKNMKREGELVNLVNEINEVSGYGSIQKQDEDDNIDDKPMMMMTPDQWAKSSQKPVYFKIERKDVILRFKLNGISGKRTKEIEIACDPGNPPREPIRGIDGRTSNEPLPNPNNPRYIKKKADMLLAERMMFIEDALPFKFPGETIEDKTKWLGARPAGEVVNLYRFVRVDNLSYKDKTDFTLGL